MHLNNPISRNTKQNCHITAMKIQGGASWNFSSIIKFPQNSNTFQSVWLEVIHWKEAVTSWWSWWLNTQAVEVTGWMWQEVGFPVLLSSLQHFFF